jgi:hypothetical protein
MYSSSCWSAIGRYPRLLSALVDGLLALSAKKVLWHHQYFKVSFDPVLTSRGCGMSTAGWGGPGHRGALSRYTSTGPDWLFNRILLRHNREQTIKGATVTCTWSTALSNTHDRQVWDVVVEAGWQQRSQHLAGQEALKRYRTTAQVLENTRVVGASPVMPLT